MGSVVETPLGVVGENVVHMAREDAFLVRLPELHVQQIAVFMQHHADLLGVEFWQSHKERILAGHVYDVFPYDTRRRFTHAAGA